MQDITFELENVDTYKKASLVLYGLGEEDRKWILSNLPKYQSDKLETLMNELVEIGISQNDSVLNEILSKTDSLDVNVEHDLSIEYAEVVKKVDSLSVDDIADILSNEPADIIAMVLSVKNWSWSTKYLSTLSVDFRDEVRLLLKKYVGTMVQPVKTAIVNYLNQNSTYKSQSNSVG